MEKQSPTHQVKLILKIVYKKLWNSRYTGFTKIKSKAFHSITNLNRTPQFVVRSVGYSTSIIRFSLVLERKHTSTTLKKMRILSSWMMIIDCNVTKFQEYFRYLAGNWWMAFYVLFDESWQNVNAVKITTCKSSSYVRTYKMKF